MQSSAIQARLRQVSYRYEFTSCFAPGLQTGRIGELKKRGNEYEES
jgi:hypothetical protein